MSSTQTSKKKKILLIRANYLPGLLGRQIVPPLGILTLAAVLRRERGGQYDIKILDTGISKTHPLQTEKFIRDFSPDIVGISALSLESANLHVIAAVTKRVSQNIKVIVGGPHATTFYDIILKDPNVDYAVVGEGEMTFVELLDYLNDGADGAGIKGVACLRNGELKFGGVRPFIEDLDSLPFPAWDLVKLLPYSRRVINMQGLLAASPYAPLFTSRACPYRCVYCHQNFGKKFRAQSAERTIEEIDMLTKKFNVKEIHIFDDVFNLDSQRVLDICEGILRKGLKIKISFPNGIRGDLLGKEVLSALSRAGTYLITYAVETATPRIQKMIHKNLDLEKIKQTIEWSFDMGIIPAGFFMFGFPTETEEEMRNTVKFALNSKLLKALFFCVVPFPRTELYDLIKKTYPQLDFSYDFTGAMHYWSTTPYYTQVTGIDVATIQKRAWAKFFLDPWRLWTILKRYPKNWNFINTAYQSIFSTFLAFGRPDAPMKELYQSVRKYTIHEESN